LTRVLWRRTGSRLALPVWLLLFAQTVYAGEQPGSVQSADAEITYSSGPGHVDARFVLRGEELTLLAPFAEDGGPVGVFSIRLPKQDPLYSALAGLPTTVAGPPPVPGMPTVRFALRGKDAKLAMRQLVATRPTADPRVDKALRELDRCERLARKHARMAFTLALRTVPTTGTASSGSRERTCVATVSAQGEAHAQAVLSTGSIVVQAAPEPGPPQPGVTPLPTEWDTVSTLASPAHSETLEPGGNLEVRLTVDGSEAGPRQLRAVFDGSIDVRLSGFSEKVKLNFSSKALALPETPGRARK